MNRTRRLVLWLLPVAVIAVGAWLIRRPVDSASFGWVAYAPLPAGSTPPIAVSAFTPFGWGTEQWLGFALASAGIVVLAFLAGRASTRGRRPPR